MKPEQTINSYGYRINPQDIDHTKHANIISAGGYVLDAAGEDAFRNGVGVAQLNEHNASWVLLRFALLFDRLPCEYEHVDVRTWVSGMNRIMTTRNLIMSDEQGNDIGMAITNWAVIDLTTRRAKDLSALNDYKHMVRNVEPPMSMPVKLQPLEQGEKAGEHRVVYSDIDFNAHTNTMSYLRWILDSYPLERFENRGIGRIDMNFIHESRFGECLEIYRHEGLKADNFEILNEKSEPVCRISIEKRD